MKSNNQSSKNESKKRILLGSTLIVFILIAVSGYLFEQKKEPIRVAFETKGGGVIFDHQFHVKLKDSKCEECHHNYLPDKKDESQMNCRACHYDSEYIEICEDENIHKRCIGKNCMDCHVSGSVSCEFCHNAEVFKKAEQPKLMTFETDGGPVAFDHFKHASPDEYDLECSECHHKINDKEPYSMNCRQCHYNTKYEKICENEDTHVRCIGKNCINCHSDGTEECEICHKEE